MINSDNTGFAYWGRVIESYICVARSSLLSLHLLSSDLALVSSLCSVAHLRRDTLHVLSSFLEGRMLKDCKIMNKQLILNPCQARVEKSW